MIYWNIGQILMDLINWLLNPKMHAKTYIYFLFLYENIKWYDFIYIFERFSHMEHIKKNYF
jgi:hypothetical protein